MIVRGLWVVLIGTAAFAQRADRSLNPQLFHPAPGPDEFVTVEPAAPLGHLQYQVGLYLNYARNPFTIDTFDVTTNKAGATRANLIANSLGADVWVALGLWRRLQLAVQVPMTLYQNGQDFNDPNPVDKGGTHIPAPSGFAFADPRLYLKLLLYGKPRGFQLALSHWLGFPLGNDGQFGGEKHYTGFSGEGRLLGEYDAERWRLALFFGFLWRAENERFFS